MPRNDEKKPYRDSETHRRVRETISRHHERANQRQPRRDAEVMLSEDDTVTAQYTLRLMALLGPLSNLSKEINKHREGHYRYPDSVLAVYELATALIDYRGELSAKNEQARQMMMEKLVEQLDIFVDKMPESTFFQAHDFHWDNRAHISARDVFQRECTKIMTQHFKDLASETSLWNDVKDLFNEVCKLLGLKPDGKWINSTLDSSELIKSQTVKEGFFAVKQTWQIEIVDEEDIDMKFMGPI